MVLLPDLVVLPAVGHPVVTGALYAAGAVGGVLVGGALRPRLARFNEWLGPISREFQPVLAIGVLTACLSALGWSLLWNLPLTGLAIIACYVAGALVAYTPRRWPIVDGVMAGLFCGFVLSLGAITFGLVDPGLV